MLISILTGFFFIILTVFSIMIMVYPNSGTPSSHGMMTLYLPYVGGRGRKGSGNSEPKTFLHQYSGAPIRLQYLDSVGFACVFITLQDVY